MGLSPLRSHQGSEGHKKALGRLNSPSTVFLNPVSKNSKVAPSVDVDMGAEQTAGLSDAESHVATTSLSQSSGEVSLLLAPAELKIALDVEIILRICFMIAVEFTFSRTKASYFLHYGVAPCFHIKIY